MSEQKERCCAVDQLKTLQGSIADLMQGMVIRRARVEKYKDTDLAAARDTFAELQQVRKRLAQAIGDARLLLMEAEEYQTAKTAAMLQAGLLGFDLMSNVYRPVYDAIQDFIKKFPVDGTANAAVIGRLMNNVKLGYYPTDPDNISLILRGIQFLEGVTTNLFDPCCGCGKALRQLAQGNNCYTYGVELNESRGSEAQTRLHRVGFGSFFFSQVSHEAFHLPFLNPPYLSVLNESGNRSRHEKRFLIESICHLMYGGLLVYIIPYYRLTPDICRVLVDNFDGLTVWRFTDSEFKKFKQIVVMGLRKRRADVPEDTLWLEKYTVDPTMIPSLTDIPENQYLLPAQPLEVKTFKGERFNEKELEQQLRSCDSFAQLMARSELDKGTKRPLLPLSISQIGLIGGSGMINGLIQCDNPHIIKGRIIKVTRTECEDRYASNGNHIGSEIHETISNNAMIFLQDESLYPLQLVLKEILIASESTVGGSGETILEQFRLANQLKYVSVIVSSLPVLCLYPFVQKYFAQGVMIGSLKE